MTESFYQLLTLVPYDIEIHPANIPTVRKNTAREELDGRACVRARGKYLQKKKTAPKFLMRVRTRGFELRTFFISTTPKIMQKRQTQAVDCRNTTDREPVGNITQLPCELVYGI